MIKLDHETADKIALEVLKDDYRMVKQNIRNIRNLKKEHDVKPYVLEDYKHDKKLLKAIKRVLEYHMTHEDYTRFIEENK